jgi:hypothetical protein
LSDERVIMVELAPRSITFLDGQSGQIVLGQFSEKQVNQSGYDTS